MNPLKLKDSAFLNQRWQTVINTVDEAIADYLKKQKAPSPLQDAMYYAALQGGKRFRPLLMQAVADYVGVDFQKVLPAAVAVEFIHAYSLVHDDLPAMDNAPLRRGKPSVWKQFDEATAILAGDALLTLAFQVLAESSLPSSISLSLVQELAKASGPSGMVGGQMLDISPVHTVNISHSEHLQNLKTGQLFAFSCISPAIVADTPLHAIESLRSVGLSLGLIYQVVDDLLDHTSTPETLGKPTQNDTQKTTFVTLLEIDGAWKFVETKINDVHQKIGAMETQGNSSLLKDLIAWMQNRTY